MRYVLPEVSGSVLDASAMMICWFILTKTIFTSSYSTPDVSNLNLRDSLRETKDGVEKEPTFLPAARTNYLLVTFFDNQCHIYVIVTSAVTGDW